jgi:16S rRNA (adenine1518-N6/adenine1519-N6)-dimethyltransferase
LFTPICEQDRSFLTKIPPPRSDVGKRSPTAAVLREIGVSPVRSLGQNFLHDRNLSRWIVDQLGPTNEDYVVEIGPGLGALTAPLLESGARILGLEKDRRLVDFLQKRFTGERLEVRHCDALDFDVPVLFTEPTVKLIGNLPYYISSQLLMRFLEDPSPISLAVLMLQKEMADRLSASPGTKDYGALTLLVQRHYRINLLRKVPATVFIPRPEVDSAVIRITPRPIAELPPFDDQLFVSLVRQGFSQRRKQLGKLLADYVSDWPAAAKSLGLDHQARAETVSLEQWIALTNFARPMPTPESVNSPAEYFPIVDDSDRVIGSAERGKVHGDNLRHRAVHILVFDRQGNLFLQKRSPWKDRHPGVWDSSAAGHVEAGEAYDEAARRELQEELGIEAPLEPVAKLPASDRTGQEFIRLYRTDYDGPMSLNKLEIEAGQHFQPAIVTGWIAARPGDFAPGFTECWKAYLNRDR